MKLELYVNGVKREIKTFSFSDGSQFVDVGDKIPEKSLVSILSYLRQGELSQSDQIMRLFTLIQICKDANSHVELFLPYVPYARMDRKMDTGQTNQLKMFVKLLNSFKLDKVYIDDPHSDVCEALIDNAVVRSQQYLLTKEFRSKFQWIKSCDAIIAPDAGANKKAHKVASEFNIPVIQCGKQRNGDGHIIKTEVYGNTSGKKLVVVDDILDGGGTFLGLANAIQDSLELNLVVTHGIFAKGKNELNKVYNRVQAVYDWLEV